jgi:Domain of unknown function (DUF1816)
MKEILISLLETLGLAWWSELVTEDPRCTYYFGPFISAEEAKAAQAGYIEDLEQEGTQGIRVTVKRCKPSNLTVFDETPETSRRSMVSPTLSGQLGDRSSKSPA